MNGREIIENADVVIRDDRIVTGKTIVPGFIDALKN